MFVRFFVFIVSLFVLCEANNYQTFLNSSKNPTDKIWHSYKFDTGVGNREELYFIKIGHSAFEPSKEVLQWKNIFANGEVILIGLGSNFLLISNFNGENDLEFFKEEIDESTNALSVFQKWDPKSQTVENFVVIAVYDSSNNYKLKWYKVQNRQLKFLTDWHFHGIITKVNVVKLNHELKLIIVSQLQGSNKNGTIYIYNFDLFPHLDVWLFEEIILDGIPSAVTAFSNNEYTFLAASVPSIEMFFIWKFSKNLCLQNYDDKHFSLHQKIFVHGLKSLISFQVDYKWYLAVASHNSSIYQMHESMLFYPINNLKLGNQNNWLNVAVDTYREDVILLSNSDSKICNLVWTRNRHFQIIKNFSKLVCGDDTACLDEINHVSLSGATTFSHNGYQNIIMPSHNGSHFVINLLVKLKPLPDTVLLKLNEIIIIKNSLENEYLNQAREMDKLEEFNVKYTAADLKDNPNEFSKFDESLQKKLAEGFASLSQINQWPVILSDIQLLESKLNSLEKKINKLDDDVNINISFTSAVPADSSLLSKNFSDGIIFYGQVEINKLNVSFVNGFGTDDLLKNSYRIDKKKVISGKKLLKRVQTNKLFFKKLGGLTACDIVFSDDPWDTENGNIINGTLIFDSKLDILNELTTEKDLNKNYTSSKMHDPDGRRKNKFDRLRMENLNITEETSITGINSRPLILPILNVPLNINYLDAVNQARVEIILVNDDLNIKLLNGKIFNNFMTEILQFSSRARILGVVESSSLDVEKVNSVLIKGRQKSEDPNERLLPTKARILEIEENFRRSKSRANKRNIHVFQDLEINGVLYANQLNNQNWNILNDTLRKGISNTVYGAKIFQKPLKVKIMWIDGLLNNLNLEILMTNNSNQEIKIPLIFNEVDFRNLSLFGYWDAIDLKALNSSILRLISNSMHNTNLIFTNDLKIENVAVLESFKISDSRDPIVSDNTESLTLQRLKASKTIVNGSFFTNNEVNNINLSVLNKIRVSQNKVQNVVIDLRYLNLTLDGDLNVINVNNNELSSLVNSESDNRIIEQFLNGQIPKIRKLLVKGTILSNKGINEWDLGRLSVNGINIRKSNILNENFTFENTVYFKNLNVSNTVNGVNLKELENDLVLRHSQISISGSKIFTNLRVLKDMKARFLNGHLVQDIVTYKGDQAMKGFVKINGDVVIRGNITTNGKLNDVQLPQLLKKFSTEYNSFMITEDLMLKSDSVNVYNLIVSGSIQNSSFNSLVENTVLKERDNDVTGKKLFKGQVKFLTSIILEEAINNVDVNELFEDIILIDRPAKIEGTTFIKEAVLSVLETKYDFNSVLINNFDLNEWFDDCIPIDQIEVVSGRIKFKRPYAMKDIRAGFVNSHMSSALISLKNKQFIPLVGHFEKLNLTLDLLVEGNVNGYNLIKKFENSVVLTENQTKINNFIFLNDLIVKGNLIIDSIKGKNIQNLVTLDTEQVINMNMIFDGAVNIKPNIDYLNFINSIDLKDWYGRSVLLNREQEISGFWSVNSIKARDVYGNAVLDRIRVLKVSKDVETSKLMLLEKRNETEIEFNSQCWELEKLSREAKKQAFLFHQFDAINIIESNSVIESIIPLKIDSLNYLITTYVNECLSSLYRWSEEISAFTYVRQINIGIVSKWLVTYHNNVTFLITSTLYDYVKCEESLQQGNVWVFENIDKYEHVLTTNGFVDIVKENNISNKFYTLGENNYLFEWFINETNAVENKFLVDIKGANYRFIDFSIFDGLAVSNGKDIKHIEGDNGKIRTTSVLSPFEDILALPVDGKLLTALVFKDKIVAYENFKEGKIFSILHTYKAGSLLWFNFGVNKQTFLILLSQHKLIEVFEYKSVSGFIKRMSLQLFSVRLQEISLPTKNKHQLVKFVVVVQKNKIILLKADMMGDYYNGGDSFC